MTLTSVQLWERIHASGLATPDQCRQWAIAVAQTSSQEVLLDPTRLMSELIKQGRITSFQANVLFHNMGIPLVLGSHQLTKSLETELGKGWYEAQSKEASELPRQWLYLLTLTTLQTPSVRKNPPYLKLANQTLNTRHPSLDRWLDAKAAPSSLFAACEAIQGQPLSSILKTRRLSWDESTAMVEQIAAGIGKLHSSGFVHGRIHLSTVWENQDGTFVLRRDPWFPPISPFASDEFTCLGDLHNELLSGAAPEFTLPASSPTIQTDLYALGCLWFASSANEPLLSAANKTTNSLTTNQDLWAKAHSTENISDRLKRNVPDRLQPCLSRLLAKNPSDRFLTARALSEAIDRAMSSQTAAPKAAVPQAAVPQAAVPKAAVPQAAVPQAAVPQAAVPQVAVPQVAVPQAAVPQVAVPQAAAPQVAVPQVAAPQAAAPQAAAPQAAAPKAAAPKAAAPKAAAPQAAAPKAAVPQAAVPQAAVPQAAVPQAAAPQAAAPQAAAPKAAEPQAAVSQAAAESAIAPPLKKRGKRKKSESGQTGQPSSTSPSNKKKKGKSKKPKWLLPAIVAGTCILFGTLIPLLLWQGSSSTPSDPTPTTVLVERPKPTQEATNAAGSVGSNAAQNKPSQVVDPIAEYYAVSADDGKSLWAPPQAGSPHSMELLPAGLEAVVFLSGNAWHQRAAMAGLGKWWLEVQPQIATLVNKYPILKDERIDSVALALYPSKVPGVPQVLFRLKMKQSFSLDSIASSLPGFSAQLLDTKSGSRRGVWSDEAGGAPSAIAFDDLATDRDATSRRLTIGPEELVLGLGELNGGLAPLRRQLELLLPTTDSRADVTVLLAPSFLFGDGRELISAWPNMALGIKELIDESTQAIAVSMFLEGRWYMELRMVNAEVRESNRIANQLKARLEKLPDEIEAAILESPSHPYWRAISQRYPQMLRSLSKFSRFGIEDGQMIANVVLPSEAASNLLIASWMSMAGPSTGSSAIAATGKKPPAPAQMKTIEEIIESKISLSFGQESLESALQLIAAEVTDSIMGGEPFAMSINGSAFQIQGITQNQQIRDFKQADAPLRAVLTDLVRRANPVTTVQSATEKDQKVVWVVIDDPNAPAKKKIELTTRTWAETNNVKLSSEFIAP